MSSAEPLLENHALDEEMDSELGDPRRTQRLGLLVNALSKNPAASYPEQLRDASQLESFYRFVGNRNIEFAAVLEGHRDATVERAESIGDVVAIHDTTDFGFPVYNDHVRDGLCRFSKHRQGFLGHASLVASADGLRCPLGIVRFQPFPYVKQLPTRAAKEFWKNGFGLAASEYDRWLQAIIETSASLANVPSVVHVMDREADSYEIMAAMQSRGYRHIIRLAQNRLTKEPDTHELQLVSEVLESQPVVAKRKTWIGPRVPAQRGASAQPARRAREAVLEFRAVTIQLKRPRARSDLSHLPATLRVNIIEAIERKPPTDAEPIHWILVTTEPIDTAEEVLHVVDLYRTRWLIEEYFKAIKTGCGYEKRQLEFAHSLLLALALTIPIAWHLLVMRHLSREAPDAPACSVVTEVQLAILKSELPRWRWSRKPTVANVTLAIARLGGHLKNNGPPGWLILGRGYTRLLEMERGWHAARRAQL